MQNTPISYNSIPISVFICMESFLWKITNNFIFLSPILTLPLIKTISNSLFSSHNVSDLYQEEGKQERN